MEKLSRNVLRGSVKKKRGAEGALKALAYTVGVRSAKLLRPRQLKVAALERGMMPDSEHPGYYRDPLAPEFLRNSNGDMIDDPKCWQCGDAGFVKIAPLQRQSRGAWDSDLMVCECWDATTQAQP